MAALLLWQLFNIEKSELMKVLREEPDFDESKVSRAFCNHICNHICNHFDESKVRPFCVPTYLAATHTAL